MKNLVRLSNLLLAVVFLFALTSCEPEPVINPIATPPRADFAFENGFLSSDATITGNELIRVKLSANQGDSPMESVEFLENGVRISDFSRITINGAAATSAAVLLSGDEKSSLIWEIEILPHSEGIADYSFVITDEANETTSLGLAITVENLPPTLSATNGTTDLQAAFGMLTTLNLMAAPGDASSTLVSLSIFENDVLATGTNRFFFGGIMAADEFEGTKTLEGDDINGFTKELFLRVASIDTLIQNLTVVITDSNGQEASLDVTLKAQSDLDGNFLGVLLNKSGPDGQGGLDLDTGNGGINSTDPDAEIKDEGNVSSTNQEWQQKISSTGVNQLGMVTANLFPENIGFDDIVSKEQVANIAQQTTQIATSEKVAVGDMFAVYNPTLDRFYLIRVSDINVTDDDNKDGYTFDIKW